MDFLKDVLGEELYKQVVSAVDAFNGKEENKDKQVKIGNIGSGEYVGKGKYSDLESKHGTVSQQLEAANKLIAELKKGGSEDQQKKVSEYERRIAELEKELAAQREESALREALRDAKVTDVDYIAFQIRKAGEIKLDADGKIKGINETIAAMKTQYPQHFATEAKNNVQVNRLPSTEGGTEGGMTRADILKKPYGERAQFAKDNPELYAQIMNS